MEKTNYKQWMKTINECSIIITAEQERQWLRRWHLNKHQKKSGIHSNESLGEGGGPSRGKADLSYKKTDVTGAKVLPWPIDHHVPIGSLHSFWLGYSGLLKIFRTCWTWSNLKLSVPIALTLGIFFYQTDMSSQGFVYCLFLQLECSSSSSRTQNIPNTQINICWLYDECIIIKHTGPTYLKTWALSLYVKILKPLKIQKVNCPNDFHDYQIIQI